MVRCQGKPAPTNGFAHDNWWTALDRHNQYQGYRVADRPCLPLAKVILTQVADEYPDINGEAGLHGGEAGDNPNLSRSLEPTLNSAELALF